MTYILALDQGTTSSRAIIFDKNMTPITTAQKEFKQYFPASGWVEHDPKDLWNSTVSTCRMALQQAKLEASDIVAIGIANQRETTLVWDKFSGVPIHHAIVWQDRRTADICYQLRATGHERMITSETGLLLDPYFSGTKLKWLLDHVKGARAKAERGDLLFGTVDSYLIWNLTGGKVHATEATNAARTLLYDIHKGQWSQEICELLKIPVVMLPEVKNSADHFGYTQTDLFGGRIPILGVAGDQQAAIVGQACFEPGMMKSTYGTGCFALLNTGDIAVRSKNRLLTTIAYQFNGKPTYALEGSIFNAGSVVQWLRDELNIIEKASDTQGLAESADQLQNLILVPAFTGLGAPYWNTECRGAIYGLTRNSGPAEFTRAALQSVGFQTRDLLEAMHSDWSGGEKPLDGVSQTKSQQKGFLRVDGGMSGSDWTMQFLSNIIGAQVDRPKVLETTALGVAWLAGMHAGVYPDQEGFSKTWALDKSFNPTMSLSDRETKYSEWKKAVSATLVV